MSHPLKQLDYYDHYVEKKNHNKKKDYADFQGNCNTPVAITVTKDGVLQ